MDIFSLSLGENLPQNVNKILNNILRTLLAINEFNEALPLFECLKQEIASSIEELDWVDVLIKVFNFNDESSNTNNLKVSVLRVRGSFLSSKCLSSYYNVSERLKN